MKTPWFSILNRGAGPTEILLFNEIGGDGQSAADFLNQLNAIGGPVVVRINSPGGSVSDGLAIYNAMQRRGNCAVEIDGMAASIASVIAMAGQPVRMAENALLMIHNPTALAWGDSGDMERASTMLEKCKESIITAYTKKTGLSAADISAMMDDETWLNASEALAQGFIDEISAPLAMAAHADYSALDAAYRAATTVQAKNAVLESFKKAVAARAVATPVRSESATALGEEMMATRDPVARGAILKRMQASAKAGLLAN